MSWILRRYSLREIIVPTLLSLFSLVFILVVAAQAPWDTDERLILTLMKLFVRPDVPRGEVAAVFLLGLPTLFMFIAPMALLIGIIIGVGRMTLDLEVRSMQTGGIHLLTVFWPMLLLGAAVSAATGWLFFSAEPRMLNASIVRGGKLLISEFNNLEPGRPYSGLFKGRKGMHLYFESRSRPEGYMEGVSLVMERGSFESDDDKGRREARNDEREDRIRKLHEEGKITLDQRYRMEYELDLDQRDEPPMMIFASRAALELSADDPVVRLDFQDGSLHLLDKPRALESDVPDVGGRAGAAGSGEATSPAAISAPDADGEPEKVRDYAVLHFDRLTKRETVGAPDSRKARRTATVPELMALYRDPAQSDKERHTALATVLERYSLSLGGIVFALLGLPLAIWIRPTGKSIGIVIAAGVIFIYHLMMRQGYSMVRGENPLGPLVIFSPNIIFGVAAVGLWVRAVRR